MTNWMRKAPAAAVIFGLTGCSTMWDDLTSRDFQLGSMFSRKDPMVVLRESTDGDARAKAIMAIQEPKGHGGGYPQQNAMMETLTRIAVSDPAPLCRLAAAQKLGEFKDPRAVQALISCYDSASTLNGDAGPAVQMAAIRGLGDTGKPEAAKFLVGIAAKPAAKDAGEKDTQIARDNRLAAVRALRNSPASQEVATAMAQIAQSERDVALRERAKETYAKVTGKELEISSPSTVIEPKLLPTNDDIQLTGGAGKQP